MSNCHLRNVASHKRALLSHGIAVVLGVEFAVLLAWLVPASDAAAAIGLLSYTCQLAIAARSMCSA